MRTINQSIFGTCLLLLATGAAMAAPVTFQVNMEYQISTAAFTPGAGQVQVRGSFDIWNYGTAPVVMTNIPSTTIYQAVVNVTNTPGSKVDFKYWNSGTGTGSNWENDPNRSLTASSTPQTVYAYFNDKFAGGPPVNVTFQVDMGVQTAKGAFDPVTGTIDVRGPWYEGVWGSGLALTNVPSTTIWQGTYGITNVPPGGRIEHKFVMNANGWEAISGGNRSIVIPNGGGTLPLVYFSNEIPTAVPVTFQVDMFFAIQAGFDPQAGDVVEARGSFQVPQNWTGGFTLTNVPGSSIYSGTTNIARLPGSVEEYKFAYVKPSTEVTWESSGNRSFVLSNATQVLPLAAWNNLSNTNDVLPMDTLVQFTVNMQGATNQNLLTRTVPFDPATMTVYVNGDFVPWWNWQAPPVTYQLFETSPGSLIYTNTVLVKKGRLVGLTYKYGVDTYFVDGGTSTDNELPFGSNHVRYVRTVGGTTVLPEDIFGSPVIEPLVGDLNISRPVSGQVTVSWRGRPGVSLQESSDLLAWSDVPNTVGTSSATLPASTTSPKYYRLVLP